MKISWIFLIVVLLNICCILPKENIKLNDDLYKISILDSISMDQLAVAQIKLTYLGEQEKPISTLIGYTTILCITDISLVTLYTLGIPNLIVSRLSTLLDKQYYSRTDFIKNLEIVIGVDNVAKYGKRIMEVSEISSGKNIEDGNYSVIYKDHDLYSNDALSNLRKFSLTPEELYKIIKKVGYEQPVKKDRVYSFSLIFMTYKEENKLFCIEGEEIYKDYYQSKILFTDLLHSLDKQNSEAYNQIWTVMNNLY